MSKIFAPAITLGLCLAALVLFTKGMADGNDLMASASVFVGLWAFIRARKWPESNNH